MKSSLIDIDVGFASSQHKEARLFALHSGDEIQYWRLLQSGKRTWEERVAKKIRARQKLETLASTAVTQVPRCKEEKR